MPKVLVQVNSLILGGSQINAVDLAAATKPFGYDAVLAGPRDTMPIGPSLADIAETRGVPLELFDGPTTVAKARNVSRLAAAHECDLVHVYGAGTYRSAYWGPARFGRLPWVFTVYEMQVDPATPRSPQLIVGTQYLLEEQIGRREDVVLISPPVDLERDNSASVEVPPFVNALEIDPSTNLIVMVTRLDSAMKALSVELAMDAISSLDSSATLLVVGTGNTESRLRRRAEPINNKYGRRAVVFAGPMSDPRPAYAAADIVIGMGGSAARALAFGKPLVVSGEFGWFRLFDPSSADALFRNSFWSDRHMPNPAHELGTQIERLISDPVLRISLGRFGRLFAADNFGLHAMAERLAQVYDRSLTQHNSLKWWRDVPLAARYAGQRAVALRNPVPGLLKEATRTLLPYRTPPA